MASACRGDSSGQIPIAVTPFEAHILFVDNPHRELYATTTAQLNAGRASDRSEDGQHYKGQLSANSGWSKMVFMVLLAPRHSM